MTFDAAAWIGKHPEFLSLRAVMCDVNAIARGKRMPISDLTKVMKDGVRMPLSVCNLDLWGDDIEDSPLVFESGDGDGILAPTDRGPVPMPWLDNPALLIPHWNFNDDGSPFAGDPRQALARVLARFAANGLAPIVATELEFSLVQIVDDKIIPATSRLTNQPMRNSDILSLDELDGFDSFFTDLYAACAQMGIPAQAAITEGGVGQFEINLNHGPAMKAADDTWLFRQAARGVARKHGMRATFMPKPYVDCAGNGLHAHFSILNEAGDNIFDDGSDEGSNALKSAVAGTLDAMAPSTLIFAPSANSYRRLAPHSHAPSNICWGYENRTAAVRIPGGPPKAKRIEHRVAGGDTNPYLFLAAVLGAALNGIEANMTPPAPIKGDAYSQDVPSLPDNWDKASDLFETAPQIAKIFDPLMIRGFAQTKRQEANIFAKNDEYFEFFSYLNAL
jgi:glutamine synthetase